MADGLELDGDGSWEVVWPAQKLGVEKVETTASDLAEKKVGRQA
jgi:hypothetical protein